MALGMGAILGLAAGAAKKMSDKANGNKMAVNQKVIDQAKKDYADAHAKGDKAGMAAAHERAEAERAKAGYSGGADGSKNISLNNKASGNAKGSSKSSSSNGGKFSTTVYTPEGSAVSGYIQDGKTYLSDGTRIGEGYTSVDKSGRYWTIKDGKGVEVGNLNDGVDIGRLGQSDYARTYDDLERRQQEIYDNILAQNQAATDASIRKSVNALENQKVGINDAMDKAAREAYIALMKSKRDLPEQYAAAGMIGGITESGLINLDNSYANNIKDINTQRTSQIADIDNAISDVRLTGDIEKAQQAANIAQQAAESYLSLATNRLALERELASEAKNDEERQLQYYLTYIDAYADDPQAEINRLLSQGVSETDPRILALRSLITQTKLRRKSYSSASSGSGSNSRRKSTVNGLNVSGTDYQRVLATLNRYYDSPTATDNGAKTIINSDMWMSDDDKDRLIGALGL